MSRLACLHGFTGRPGAWASALRDVPPGVEILTPTLHGHDGQASPPTRFTDEVDRLAEELRRVATNGWHLAGYSLGARLALGLLVRHRGLFASATLIGVHPGLSTEDERSQRQAADEALAQRLETEGLERFVDFWQNIPLFHSQQALPPAVRQSQRAARLEHSAAGLASSLRCLSLGAMPDFNPQLPALDLPVQLLVGELDIKFHRLAKGMVRTLPQATLGVVPSAGHNLLLEAPRAVATALHRVLR
ncbi:MAG: alpha/beta fold hydrolase [Acidobacteriota bacterium]